MGQGAADDTTRGSRLSREPESANLCPPPACKQRVAGGGGPCATMEDPPGPFHDKLTARRKGFQGMRFGGGPAWRNRRSSGTRQPGRREWGAGALGAWSRQALRGREGWSPADGSGTRQPRPGLTPSPRRSLGPGRQHGVLPQPPPPPRESALRGGGAPWHSLGGLGFRLRPFCPHRPEDRRSRWGGRLCRAVLWSLSPLTS